MHTLINKEGKPVNVGDTARDIRGDIVIINGWKRPTWINGDGLIYITTEDNKFYSEHSPRMCGMKFKAN